MLTTTSKNQNTMSIDRLEITKETNNDGSKKVTYRKEWKENGLTCTKEVRKVEGGYIIRESKWGKPKNVEDVEGEDYVDETKEYVTTENPLKEKEEKSDDEKMFDFIDKPLF